MTLVIRTVYFLLWEFSGIHNHYAVQSAQVILHTVHYVVRCNVDVMLSVRLHVRFSQNDTCGCNIIKLHSTQSLINQSIVSSMRYCLCMYIWPIDIYRLHLINELMHDILGSFINSGPSFFS